MTKLAKRIFIGVAVGLLLLAIGAGTLVGLALIGSNQALRAGNEAVTVSHMQTILAVQSQYYNTHSRNFGAFDQLVSESLLDRRFAGVRPIVDGYVYELRVNPKNSTQQSSYTLSADPGSDDDGIKHFFADSTDGVVRVSSNRRATAADPPVSQ